VNLVASNSMQTDTVLGIPQIIGHIKKPRIYEKNCNIFQMHSNSSIRISQLKFSLKRITVQWNQQMMKQTIDQEHYQLRLSLVLQNILFRSNEPNQTQRPATRSLSRRQREIILNYINIKLYYSTPTSIVFFFLLAPWRYSSTL